MSRIARIARAVALALVSVVAAGLSGCASPRAHPWNPPGFRPAIHTWTATYGEFPPDINDKPHEFVQGDPSDG
jgi:hypothetical protein